MLALSCLVDRSRSVCSPLRLKAFLGARRGTSGSKVGPSGPETTDAVPVTAEQAPTGGSSRGKNSKKKKKNTEARKESNEVEQTDVDDSSKKGGKKRKAGDPPAEDAPKKKKMKKKDSSLPRPSSVCEEELQALVPDATPEAGTPDDDENETIALRRRRREDPKETPEDGFKFEFNRELPLACYPEDCARLLQLVKGGPDQLPPVGDLLFKDEYEHATCSSVKSQGDWNILVEKYDTALKRTREQVREGEDARKKTEEALRIALRDKSDAITREKTLRKAFDETRTSDAVELQMCKESMKDLELVLDKVVKEKAGLEKARAAESLKYEEEMNRLRKSLRYEVTHERIRVMIALIAKAEKCFHRISLREVPEGELLGVRLVLRGRRLLTLFLLPPSKHLQKRKKRKAGDPPAEDAPKKKKMKKKDSSLPRPSSVCEEELQALVPDATPEAGTSDDDENETIALRRRRREGRTTEGGSREVTTGDWGISEVPSKLPASEGQPGRLMADSSAHITEGSETRVSGCPKETPEDGFKFEFSRELPLACYPGDCARLLQLVKGGPDQLPLVGDLLFKDEYEHAACSSVKSQGDWNVLVEKYNTALKQTREQVREALRKAFDETRTFDPVELQMCKESMKNLKLRADQEADRTKQTSIDAVIPKDGTVPTIVLTDSPAKASKNLSSSTSSSEELEKENGVSAGRPEGVSTVNEDPPVLTFGRNLGPGEKDGARTREQVREGEDARKKTEEALRIALRDKSDAITREKTLRKAFDETRTSDAVELQMCKESMKDLELVLDKVVKEKAGLEKARAAESLKYEEEMNRLRKSLRYERVDQDADRTKQTSIDAVIPKDGVVPTIVLTDSPVKASKNLSSSTSSSEELEKEDGVSAGRPEGVSTVNEDPPVLTFGRISGPGEKDGAVSKDPPVING
ncbi:hypothetical protein F2Q68_00009855 [Brassica cretica]|uniref:Uncharacterized protein n=1 Tax=Brassica cretica TaxID=69181 RepID=A0A8S9L2L1_BRACR|nr:hypothetical protein F2Q68_00009855 [Brassica cretica]